MKAHMRMTNPIYDPATDLERHYWALLFGGCIQRIRISSDRSIEQLAQLAGMESSEWMALEDGTLLPQTEQELRTIAAALEVSFLKLANLTIMCIKGWGK